MTNTYAVETTGQATSASRRGLNLPASYIAIGIAWAAAMTALSLMGAFVPVGAAPPPAMPVAILAPPALFLLAHRLLPSVRAWVASLDLAAVTALQGWRVLGSVFMFLWFYGMLPAAFAWPAGLGDVAVGLAAPFVTAAVVNGSDGWQRRSMFLIIAGLFDFVVAVGTGILSIDGGLLAFAGQPGSNLVNAFPLVMIPALLVPMFIIFHLIAWIKLRDLRSQG